MTVNIVVKPRRVKATKPELARYAKLKELGCIIERLHYGRWEYPEIHHITKGGRRLGNEFTIPLTPWRHRGILPDRFNTNSQALAYCGPSLEISKRDFVKMYGTEMELLAKTNELLERM